MSIVTDFTIIIVIIIIIFIIAMVTFQFKFFFYLLHVTLVHNHLPAIYNAQVYALINAIEDEHSKTSILHLVQKGQNVCWPRHGTILVINITALTLEKKTLDRWTDSLQTPYHSFTLTLSAKIEREKYIQLQTISLDQMCITIRGDTSTQVQRKDLEHTIIKKLLKLQINTKKLLPSFVLVLPYSSHQLKGMRWLSQANVSTVRLVM